MGKLQFETDGTLVYQFDKIVTLIIIIIIIIIITTYYRYHHQFTCLLSTRSIFEYIHASIS
jgi:hypothetical protein